MSVFADFSTVPDVSSSEFKTKGSRFIGIAMPCASEDAIRRNLEFVSQQYPGATHYCYAVVYGGTDRREKSSDNGEPSGTAAKPILSVIKGHDLTDTMVVAVRYFGGTLLGTGGLVHAYTQAAENALSLAAVKKVTACAVFSITIPYADLGGFNAKCRDLCAVPPQYEYSDVVRIEAAVPINDKDAFIEKTQDATDRHATIVPCGTGYR